MTGAFVYDDGRAVVEHADPPLRRGLIALLDAAPQPDLLQVACDYLAVQPSISEVRGQMLGALGSYAEDPIPPARREDDELRIRSAPTRRA